MNQMKDIERFVPENQKEQGSKDQMLALAGQEEALLTRTNKKMHFTASGLIFNPELNKVLLVFHSLYQSWSWTGGHADGNCDLLWVALSEALEETGLSYVFPLAGEPLSLDFLPVPSHEKNGELIEEHIHLSAAFALIAPEEQSLCARSGENSAVKWVDLSELEAHCAEEHMLPIYRKIIRKAKKLKAQRDFSLVPLVLPLLLWYEQNKRILPWRENRDPYRIWVSEIMLQQTRVEAVIPYYLRFLERLPTIEALSRVSEDELLKLWEGLGYYSRVRNMKKAACLIMETMNGVFPEEEKTLRILPGIGEYTAGAILSIAFEKPVPAVDGNVLRVLSRVTASGRDIADKKVKDEFAIRLKTIYPHGRCGDFTQSLMELGATVCLPNGLPKCGECPLSVLCRANITQNHLAYPVKSPKASRKLAEKTVLLLRHHDRVALRKREGKGLLSGLWEFPNLDGYAGNEEIEAMLKQWGLTGRSIRPAGNAKHIFTHIEWHMKGYFVDCEKTNEEFVWMNKKEIAKKLSLPTAFKAFYNKL